MTRTTFVVTGLVVFAALVLTGLALTRPSPGPFAFKWYWSNNGVGNYVADLTVVALGARKIVKEWRAHKAHQERHARRLEELHDKIDRLGLGK